MDLDHRCDLFFYDKKGEIIASVRKIYSYFFSVIFFTNAAAYDKKGEIIASVRKIFSYF